MVTSISLVIVVNRQFDCQILVQTTTSVWENVVETFKNYGEPIYVANMTKRAC